MSDEYQLAIVGTTTDSFSRRNGDSLHITNKERLHLQYRRTLTAQTEAQYGVPDGEEPRTSQSHLTKKRRRRQNSRVPSLTSALISKRTAPGPSSGTSFEEQTLSEHQEGNTRYVDRYPSHASHSAAFYSGLALRRTSILWNDGCGEATYAAYSTLKK